MATTSANSTDIISDTERFTEGDCWVLMKRLHRVTDWPCASFYRHTIQGLEICLHGFVQRPDGVYLDVDGLWSKKSLLSQYSDYQDEFDGIDTFPLADFGLIEDSFNGSFERAKIVAEELLDKYAGGW